MFNNKKNELGEKEILKKIALSKLKRLRKKKIDENLFDDFSYIFRVFVMQFFKIDYEFTYDELEREIKKQRCKSKLKENIIGLSSKIANISYMGEKIGNEEFRVMINNLEEIIGLAVPTKAIYEPKGIKEGVKQKKENKRGKIKKEKGAVLEILTKIGLIKTKKEPKWKKKERAKKAQEEKIKEKGSKKIKRRKNYNKD